MTHKAEDHGVWEDEEENEQFLPFNYTQMLYQRLQNFRQGSRTVDDYTKEFYQPNARNDFTESDEQQVAHYIDGLRQSIQDALSLFTFWRVNEAYQWTLTVEQKATRTSTRSSTCGDVSAHGTRALEWRMEIRKPHSGGRETTTAPPNRTPPKMVIGRAQATSTGLCCFKVQWNW